MTQRTPRVIACLAVIAALVLPALPAAANGIVKLQSSHSVAETADRFEAAAAARGMKVFPRVDHAAAASDHGLSMPAALVISVGNPKYGTPFMQTNPVAAIDFPPKALVYEDADGTVWLAYNSSAYLFEVIFERHGLDYPEGDVAFYADVLKDLAAQATGQPAD